MDKLKELCKRCKCGIFITINAHRDYCQSVEKALKEKDTYPCPPEISDDVRAEMIKRDTIINIQAYPDTPIGSYDVYHWDLDTALDEILEACRQRDRKG